MEKWSEEELVPIRSRVFTYLKNAILEGEYKAGDRLVERELADKLKISRTPIREALLRLESIGLVKTVPRKGVVVTEVSYEEILEVFTILSTLEAVAVKLACQKLDEATKSKIDEMVKQIDSVLTGEKQCDIFQFHIDMHEEFYKTAKSPKLCEILVGLVDYIRAFANIGYERPGRMKQAMEEHRQILVAVSNREDELAEYLSKIHIENSKKAYIDAMKMKKNKQFK